MSINLTSLVLLPSFFGILYTKKRYETKYYDKIYKVIWNKGHIFDDKYHRILDKELVKEFCKISKEMGIELNDEIDDIIFDKIYKIYVDNKVDYLTRL